MLRTPKFVFLPEPFPCTSWTCLSKWLLNTSTWMANRYVEKCPKLNFQSPHVPSPLKNSGSLITPILINDNSALPAAQGLKPQSSLSLLIQPSNLQILSIPLAWSIQNLTTSYSCTGTTLSVLLSFLLWIRRKPKCSLFLLLSSTGYFQQKSYSEPKVRSYHVFTQSPPMVFHLTQEEKWKSLQWPTDLDDPIYYYTPPTHTYSEPHWPLWYGLNMTGLLLPQFLELAIPYVQTPPPSYCSNVTFTVRPSLTILLKLQSSLSPYGLFILSLSYFMFHCTYWLWHTLCHSYVSFFFSLLSTRMVSFMKAGILFPLLTATYWIARMVHKCSTSSCWVEWNKA